MRSKQYFTQIAILVVIILSGMSTLKAQVKEVSIKKGIEGSISFGINSPYNTLHKDDPKTTYSNSPFKRGHNFALDIAYHWKRIGIGLQLSSHTINNREYTWTYITGAFKSVHTAAKYRGPKSNVSSFFIPIYLHLYNSRRIRISPMVAVGSSSYRKQAFTWTIEQNNSTHDQDVNYSRHEMIATKIGLWISYWITDKIAVHCHASKQHHDAIFGSTIDYYEYNIGVTSNLGKRTK